MSELINNISVIAQLFIPGWVMLSTIKLITNKSIANDQERWVTAIIASLIMTGAYNTIMLLGHKQIGFDAVSFFVLCIFGFVIGLIVGLIYQSNGVNTWFSKRFIRTIRGSIWEDLIDYDKDTRMIITLHNGHTIIGTMDYIEEHGVDSWLALVEFAYDLGETAYDSADYDNHGIDARIAIKLSDIEAVQICYFPDQPED